jgi:flotillin
METTINLGMVLGAIVLAAIGAVVLTIKALIVIVPPNMAAVITGRKRQLEAGAESVEVGYRTVTGGRTLRIPIIERVQWMSLGTIPLELSVQDAYSKGNIPLAVQAVANVKIASAPESVFNNAVERLLGKLPDQIEALAKETLTGNLRGVLAKLTPEEVNEDRLGFARHLSEEADHDLKKLGLQLDVLKIQHVSDRVGYLKAMGEKATAEAIRDAEIAKATAEAETRQRQVEARKLAEVAAAQNEAETKERQAEARRLAEVAEAEAEVEIAEARNRLRVRQAELDREAETAEKVARVEAQRAETEARKALEARRIELEETRLQADVVAPAEAERQAAEARARAAAAPILESGRAQAEVLRMIYAEIERGGESGLKVFLAEKLPALLEVTAGAMQDVRIDRLTVIDGGGDGVANAATQRVNASLVALEQIAGALGLDLDDFLRKVTRVAVPAGQTLD